MSVSDGAEPVSRSVPLIDFDAVGPPASVEVAVVSRLDDALRVGLNGWPIKPLWPGSKRQRTAAGSLPARDSATVIAQWTKWPDSGIGVVLNDADVVVLDLDGPRGREGLDLLLRRADLDALPPTYTVTTGRAEGGKHLWFRLPEGVPGLRNQVGGKGSRFGETLGLDVLFNGIAVAVGSLHKSGAVYTSEQGSLPMRDGLAELPLAFYEVLRQRGRVKTQPVEPVPAGEPREPITPVLVVVGPQSSKVSRNVQRLLDDGSDGRIARCFQAVRLLVTLLWEDEAIIEALLGSVVGQKAREKQPYNPEGWVQDQINSARAYPAPPPFDKADWWWVVHTSGFSPGKVRACDALLRRASPWGTVTYSQGYLAVDSALSSTSTLLRELEVSGFLHVHEPGTYVKPNVYRLTLPDGLDEDLTPPRHPQSVLSVEKPVLLPGHDAFRPKHGSLNSCYPLLTLLGRKPVSQAILSDLLHLTPRALNERVKTLADVGIAVDAKEGVSLTTKSLVPRLAGVAHAAGTKGMRAVALKAIKDKAAAWEQEQRQAAIPGTDAWRKVRRRDCLRRIEEGCYAPVLLEGIGGGDPSVLASWLVEHELLALTATRAVSPIQTRLLGATS